MLTADIDLGDAQWMPVGSAGGHYFSGVFDGQNHCISGMKIGTQEAPADYVSAGLFACIDGAVVRNLAVADAEIYIARPDAVRTYAGIIAGVTDNSETGAGAVINNCAVSGTIYNKSVDWSQNGGITAYCYNSMILNCGAQVDITSISTGGTALAGGIVGQDGFAIVANNYARGSIYAEAGVNSATIGGIAGMQAGVAGNNYADVKLVSKNATGDIGGITGRNTAIGTIIYGYFNSEQEQRSGNAVIAEPKAVGENVTMLGNTGVVKETAGMTAAELKSEAFRDLLNDNQCEDKELRTALAEGISNFDIVVRETKFTIDSWVLDGIVRQGNAPTLVAPKPAIKFVDVPEAAYYYDAVQWAVGASVTSGTDSTHFSPNMTCTRAQAIMFLWCAAGRPTPETTNNPFVDVSTDDYYYQAVLWAVAKGITGGTSRAHFSPNAQVTRAQAIMFLYRYAGSPAVEHATSFDDVAPTAYYAKAVAWAAAAGITGGTGNNCFSPNASCTRAQIVCFLYKHFAA